MKLTYETRKPLIRVGQGGVSELTLCETPTRYLAIPSASVLIFGPIPISIRTSQPPTKMLQTLALLA